MQSRPAQSRPASVLDPFLFDGDLSGVTADQSGVNAVDRFDGSPSIGRDAYRPASQEATVGAGSVVIGFLWLALYLIAVVYTQTSEHRASASIQKIAPANVTAPRAQP